MMEHAAAQPQQETPTANAASKGALAAVGPASFYIGSDVESEHTAVQKHKPLEPGVSERQPETTGPKTGTSTLMWWHKDYKSNTQKETAPGTKATAEEPNMKINKIKT